MSHPHALTSLTPREAITDALHRVLISFDRHDTSIFNSAFASEDVTLELDGKPVTGLSNIRTQLLDHVGPMDTTHMISNVRVDIKDGADTASMTAYFMAQHCPPGRGKEADAPKFLAGGEYRVDVVKGGEADGMWKITKMVVDIIWRQGDASVMRGVGGGGPPK